MSPRERPELEFHRAGSEVQIAACFDVLHELRPHLVLAEFVETIRWMMDYHSYRLVYAISRRRIVCVAGYRVLHLLSLGAFLSVDDLVTTGSARSGGIGAAMLDWLREEAGRERCDHLRIDAGPEDDRAQEFFRRRGLALAAHRFTTAIDVRVTSGQE